MGGSMMVPNLNTYRTYQIIAPAATHFRPATCAEIQCGAHVNGWKTIVASDSPQAQYIRSGSSGRTYTATQPVLGMTEFVFPAGQQCFAASNHRVPLERDPLYRVRDGASAPITHTRPELWTEDLAGHLDKVKRIREG